MPRYEYQCGGCGHEFEETLKHSDPTPPCPHCEDDARVVKLVSAPGGYQMNSGGGSTRPRQAGAFRTKAVKR